MEEARLRNRIKYLLAHADSTTFPEEADTARSLAAILQEKLDSISEGIAQTEEIESSKPINYYQPDSFVDRYEEFWGFKAWTRYTSEIHNAHSADPINRDFSTWIGRKSAQNPQFKEFWNSMSKPERKLWKQTHWRAPLALAGESKPLVYHRGKWVSPDRAIAHTKYWNEIFQSMR